jgi:hypothetical protein
MNPNYCCVCIRYHDNVFNEPLPSNDRELLFFRFPNLFAICTDTFKYNQQMVCWEARAGRGVLCNTLP